MDNLEAMRIFVSVAIQGSFTEASRRMRLSPSVVTRSVAQIEERLGIMLLNRTTRSVQLTERGQIYLEDCKRILEDFEMAERRVRGEDAKPRGTLRITAPVLFGRLYVLPIVNALLHEYPALSIHLTLSDRNVNLFEEGVDVAVHVGELADSSLIALKLGLATPVLVASPAYLQKRGAPASPAALSSHDIILFEGIGATNEWSFGADRKTVRVEPRLIVNGADAAITAAEAGVGISRTLLYQVWEALRAGRLTLVLQDFAPPPLPVSVAYQARRIASANVAIFVKAIREHFKANPLAQFNGPQSPSERN
ncbi:MAG: LysR family transcriptional regulator [Acidiphilium sp. 37-64-53]|uniref:LysR family transcriptional regulator n=1 Tax=unclassified Acidiphilium TaxID=2617493 RepID=UPI000BC4C431|nr:MULTISPECIES: LysR family transcriptional regulator [unclassified Acidiphilium]OYV99870.1 MAG: LysR family transcriptional regulator [Acidiphilium sp. 37-64-53]OZB22878.1 MAG: LysR family transcriptional regulator [Acidiphilium sp. 34-64-41]HQT90045.1 LysR family transcriptional regulator [Acidiphilium sp.]